MYQSFLPPKNLVFVLSTSCCLTLFGYVDDAEYPTAESAIKNEANCPTIEHITRSAEKVSVVSSPSLYFDKKAAN